MAELHVLTISPKKKERERERQKRNENEKNIALSLSLSVSSSEIYLTLATVSPVLHRCIAVCRILPLGHSGFQRIPPKLQPSIGHLQSWFATNGAADATRLLALLLGARSY